jgi:hypothetical protein
MSPGRKKAGDPSPDDLVKAELVEKFRTALAGMRRPSSNRVLLGGWDDQWSYKTCLFLQGMSDDGRPWEQQAWLASSDLHGCGVPAEDVLDLLVQAVGAWDDEAKREKILRVVANAYSKARTPHRSYRDRAAETKRKRTPSSDTSARPGTLGG